MTGIIIQARLGSTRLPRKVLLPIDGKPVIWHVISRCRETGFPVVLAIPGGELSDFVNALSPYMASDNEEFNIYEGHPTDVLDRYYEVAKAFKFDPIVRITGDCPLVDPNMIKAMVEKFERGYLSNCHPTRTVPPGMDIEIFSFALLEHTWHSGNKPGDREHVTQYMYRVQKGAYAFKEYNLKRLWDECLTYSPPFPDSWKMSIDTQEDYERVKAMIEEGKFPWLN